MEAITSKKEERSMRKNVCNTDCAVVLNTKKAAGQVVDHIHLHLIGGKPLGPMA